jgi:hypothetical protein
VRGNGDKRICQVCIQQLAETFGDAFYSKPLLSRGSVRLALEAEISAFGWIFDWRRHRLPQRHQGRVTIGLSDRTTALSGLVSDIPLVSPKASYGENRASLSSFPYSSY